MHFTDTPSPKATIVCTCLMVLTATLLLPSCHRSRVSDEDYKALIEKNLPLRSTPQNVVSFLDSQGIENAGYKEGLEPLFSPTDSRPIPDNKRYVVGRIRNVESDSLTTMDMYLIFYFDSEAKLIEYKIKRVGTGP